ncbi:uncharacterized protein [Dasypus novemcinctus]|uniref:uncharacterized protein n=1 Tax=Dasypus novemcinctus TaxID=9361 RepID=UPI00265F27FC|nr:uncharacterized protein LOC131275196 [Dasypus novemcinctus]
MTRTPLDSICSQVPSVSLPEIKVDIITALRRRPLEAPNTENFSMTVRVPDHERRRIRGQGLLKKVNGVGDGGRGLKNVPEDSEGWQGDRVTEALTRAAPGPVKAHDPVDALFRVQEQLSPPQFGPTLGSRQAFTRRGPWPVSAVSSEGHRLHCPFHSQAVVVVAAAVAAARKTSGPTAGRAYPSHGRPAREQSRRLQKARVRRPMGPSVRLCAAILSEGSAGYPSPCWFLLTLLLPSSASPLMSTSGEENGPQPTSTASGIEAKTSYVGSWGSTTDLVFSFVCCFWFFRRHRDQTADLPRGKQALSCLSHICYLCSSFFFLSVFKFISELQRLFLLPHVFRISCISPFSLSCHNQTESTRTFFLHI